MKTDPERELAKFEFVADVWRTQRPFWMTLLVIWIVIELLCYL